MRDALSALPLVGTAAPRAPRRLPAGVGLLAGACVSVGLWIGLIELAARLWR